MARVVINDQEQQLGWEQYHAFACDARSNFWGLSVEPVNSRLADSVRLAAAKLLYIDEPFRTAHIAVSGQESSLKILDPEFIGVGRL